MKHFILILLCAFSLKAYSQCHLPLKTETIKFCGKQITVTAPIADSADFHYKWYYPNDTIAPYASHSFILSKPEYDSLYDIMKKAFPLCNNCTPFFRLQITSDSGCISDKVAINISRNPALVETPSICLITIDSLNHNHLIIAKPAISPDSIIIEKFTGNHWQPIHAIKKNNLLEYTDAGSNAATQTYSYRLIAYNYDSCLLQTNASAPSIIHTSILLQVSPNPTSGYNLSWSKYVGLNDSELAGYFIYKGSSFANMAIIDTTQSLANTAWTDPDASNENFFYYVEAIKSHGCELGQHMKQQLSIRSNSAKRLLSGTVASNLPELDIKIVNGVLYTDKPCAVYIANGIGQVTFSANSNGELLLTFTKGLNIIMVDGKAVLKKMY